MNSGSVNRLESTRWSAILCAVMFVSGASALVFQLLWFHQAGIAFGNSVWASSLVLTGFMGGLAVGSLTAIWRGDRMGPPLRTYAILELIIAGSGVILVIVLPSLGSITAPLLGQLAGHPWALNPVRLAIALAVLLVPTTAMGLTLPLLVKALVRVDPNFGRVLGRLYGWNTLGAVTGVLLAEMVLVEVLGIVGSSLIAASLNILAALAAAVVARSFGPALAERGPERAETPAWMHNKIWLAAAFLSGFALLALEVVWFRFLLLFVEGSALSFAVMLAVVLTGISLGGLFASVWLRVQPHAAGYAPIVSILSALLCVTSYGIFGFVVEPLGTSAIRGFFPVLIVSIPLMLPVSLLSGVFFTLAGTALNRGLPTVVTATGVLTFANTTGAALGALVAGFVMLPTLGMAASFMVISVLYVGIGVFLVPEGALPRRIVYPLGAALVIGSLFYPFEGIIREHVVTAAGRYSGARAWRVVGAREGVTETILYVEEYVHGHPSHLRLVTNALSMSSTEFHGRRYMKLYVYLPVAIHPNPREALLISYGVGSTAKALTDTPSLNRIDVVDISRDILEMSSLVFPDSSENPLNDPRVVVHVEDGRHFLETTDQTFDLITGEPPPPHIANVVNLYTREYFQLVRDRLNEGGYVTYWLPLHALSDRSAKAIIRAFQDVFPSASIWHGWREDVMLVGGGDAEAPVSLEWFERQWREPVVAEELRALGFERPEQIGALFIGDGDYLRTLTRDVAPLIDNFPKRILADSVSSPGANRLFDELSDTDAAQVRFERSEFIARTWPASLVHSSLPYFEYQRITNNLIGVTGHPLEKSAADLHRVLTESPLEAPVLWHLGSNSTVRSILARLSPEEHGTPFWQYHRGARLLSERKFDEAADAFRTAEADPMQLSAARMFRIYALCLAGRRDQADSLARESYPILGGEAPLEAWWDLLSRTCGIDPRSNSGLSALPTVSRILAPRFGALPSRPLSS